MHVVIIGLGEVGRQLIRSLEPDGHDIVAIDYSSEAVRVVNEKFDVKTRVGYGASEDLFLDKDIAVENADLVVAVTDHDEVNLVAALMAKSAGAKQVIARTQRVDFARTREGIRRGFLGLDYIINPTVLVARELVKIARSHGAVEVIDLSRDRIELVQVEVKEKSRFVHRPISSVPLTGTLVAAVVRKGELFIPGGSDNLLPGDRLYLVGRPKDLLSAEDLFTARRQARTACIAGGGLTAEMVARELLEDGASVKIIESNPQRADKLKGEFPQKNAEVVTGDATDVNVLLGERVGSLDLFAAATPNDELNLMASLLAKNMGGDGQGSLQTAAIVHRPEARNIYKQLGIDIVVSPRTVASDHILRFSRTSHVRSLTKIQGGQAEVLEIDALEGSRAVGTPLRQLSMPRGSLVGAIVHQEQVVIPGGNDLIRAGDSVIVLAKKGARASLERLFRPGLL
jgi:trk system potassium uptake protein TrkA